MPILDDIFVSGPSLEDAYIPLSTNPQNWPNEALEKFFADFPYLKDTTVRTKITKSDEGTKSMLGSIEVIFAKEQVVFPLIIRQGKLSPFDVMICQGTYYPATETRLRLVISKQSIVGSTTTNPEESTSLSETTQTPDLMTDQPTVYQKTSSVLSKLAFTVNPAEKSKLLKYIRDNKDLVALSQYPEVSKVFKELVDMPVLSDEQYNTALSAMIPVGVLQIRKNDDDSYTVLTSSDRVFHPVEQKLSIEELNAYLETFLDQSWPVLDSVNRNGSVTVSMMDNSGSVAVLKTKIEDTMEVTDPGTYICKTDSGSYVKGKIIPIFDYLVRPTHMNLFYNSSYYAIQDKYAGEKTEEFESPRGVEPAPGMTGTFIHKTKPIAMMPFTITATHMRMDWDNQKSYNVNAVSVDNKQVNFHLSYSTKGWVKKLDRDEQSKEVVLLDGERQNSYLVSASDFVFVNLQEPVNLAKYANQFSKEASLRYGDRLKIRSDGSRFMMEGACLSKYASVAPVLTGKGSRKTFNFNDMDYHDSKFFLGAIGFTTGRSDEILKKARINGKAELIKVSFPQTIYERKEEFVPRATAALQAIPAIKADFIKQAAMIRDEVALDQVLGLNLVSQDNILYFVSALPEIQKTIERLAALLVFVRLGFKAIPEAAVRDTMLGLEKIWGAINLFKSSIEKE